MSIAGDGGRVHVELERIIANVKSHDAPVRRVGSEHLRKYVCAMATELSQERLVAFQRLLNQKLQELFRGQIDANRIAGTICVSVLIDIDLTAQTNLLECCP